MRVENSIVKYFIFIFLIIFQPLFAQDLEPRRWNFLAAGSNILGINYGHISGEIGFDPVLDVKDTKVKRDFLLINYTRFFLLSEKLMRFDVVLPLHNAKWNGLLSGEEATRHDKGFGSPLFRLSVNLLDTESTMLNDSVDVIKTVVGASIALRVPWGKYDADKLLNITANQYTIRPQLGVVHTRGPWSYELTGSVYYFTDNDNFFNGNKLQKRPFYSAQTHMIYIFEKGIWGSLSAGYGKGGALRINGVNRDDKREGFLGAVSLGMPVTETQSLKLSCIWAKTQTDTETRSKTNTITAGWSIIF